jgi:hypothetical protein
MSAINSKQYVDLGFADEQDDWLLTNRYFPSKIGGFPAWLSKMKTNKFSFSTISHCI